jgi:hypothetical protein
VSTSPQLTSPRQVLPSLSRRFVVWSFD